MTTIERYIAYEGVFGILSTRQEFDSISRSLDLGAVLRIFAQSMWFARAEGWPDADLTQRRLVSEMFDVNVAERIYGTSLRVFHRHQCLFVMREAMRLCPTVEPLQIDAQVLKKIGLLILMANEHSSSEIRAEDRPAADWESLMCE